MAVTFDAVGPSSSGQVSAASPTTWAHVNSGNCIVVIANWTTGGSSNITAVTYGGTALSRITQVAGGGGTSGGCDIWGVISGALPTGSNTVSVTGGSPSSTNHVCCGSLSFIGAVTFGTPFTNSATAGTLSVTVTGTTAGGMIVAGASFGGSFVSATANSPGTLQYSAIGDTNGGADQTFGQTCASPGGSQAVGFTWSSGSDFIGLVAVEITGSGGTPTQGPRPQRGGKRYRSHFGHRMTPQPALLAAQVVQARADIATATAAALSPQFPTYITGVASPTGSSYFIDNHGNPRMWAGDEIWALLTNAGRWNSGNYQSTFDTYFATRAAQGYTICYSDMFNSAFITNNVATNGQMWNGQTPFTGNNPSSGLNNSYWTVIDYALNSAAANGITIALSFGGHWDWDVSGNAMFGFTSTQYTDAGNAIGSRYKGQSNLIWLIMDDYFSSFDSSLTALLTGLRNSGDTHPIAIENYAETSSRFDLSNNTSLAWGASHTQYNFGYSYSESYLNIEYMYAESSPLTCIFGDGYFYQGGSTYQGGSGAGALDRAVRQDAWWAVTSGARGWDLGDEALWQWPSSAPAAVSTQWFAANNLGNIRTFMESLPGWQTLAPATGSTLITAGRGTRGTQLASGGGGGQYEPATTSNYVSASRTPDAGSGSSLAVMYLPNATTITIDTTKIAAGYSAFWVDPITGVKTSTTTGSTYNSTAQGNNSRGDPDWVLLLQGPAGVTVTAGLATATAQALGDDNNASFAIAITVNSGIATGTGAALAPAPAIGANDSVATGSGAALAPLPAVGANDSLAIGAGAALTAADAIVGQSGLATGTGNPLNPTPSLGANAGLANAIAGALNATVSTSGSTNVNAGLATATAAALGPSVAINVNAQVATGTGATTSAAAAISGQSGLATGTGSSLSPSPQLNPNAGLATGTGGALSARNSIGANSGIATGTGAALSPAAADGVNAGLATGTGAALTAQAAIAVNASIAPATAAALQASVQTSGSSNANAGLASATGAALGPVPAIGVNAGVATGTGAALSAQAGAGANAGVAAATAAALQPSIQTAGNVTANAGLAAATGTALGPAAAITVNATVAAGTGIAFNPGHGAGIGLAAAIAAALQPGQFAITFTSGMASAAAAALQPIAQGAAAVVKGHVVTGVTGKNQSGTVTDTTEASTKVTGKSLSGSVT